MKTLIRKFIFSGLITIAFFGFAPNVFAVPLEVTFVPDPLFSEANFLPLDETSGEVTVTNNSGVEQTILTEAINILDDDNFGILLHIKIVGSSGTLFDDSLSDFFTSAGEFLLGTISDGETKTFTFTISFTNSSDNSYQGKTLGFDVCVGFQGGTTHCGNTTVGGEEDTGGGTGGDPNGGVVPGSGGGSNGPPPSTTLVISNEQTEDISEDLPTATATITWDTNILSTSQVVYGLDSLGPYTLDLNAVNFGYPSGTIEDTTKVLHHSVIITGLTIGQTYVYRVVSRASPPTISFEHQFTAPLATSPLAQGNNSTFTGGNPSANTGGGSSSENDSGAVSGGNAENNGDDVAVDVPEQIPVSTVNSTNNNQLAAVSASKSDSSNGWYWWFMSLLLLVILIVYYVTRKGKVR